MKMIEEKIGKYEAVLHGCIHASSLELAALLVRPAVLVLPGYGYQFCSEREGEPVALATLRHGYHAFWLSYTVNSKVPMEETSPKALEDALAAIDWILQNAKELGIDEKRIVVIGFGVGAQLASALACKADHRPAAQVLGYPDYETGMPDVDSDIPPAFLFAGCADPKGSSKEAMRYAAALAKEDIPYELHIFASAQPNMAMAQQRVTGGNDDACAAQWFEMAMKFLEGTLFGKGLNEKRPMRMYSVDSSIGELMSDACSAAIFEKYLGQMRRKMGANAMLAGMSPRQIARYSKGMIPDAVIDAMEEELKGLKQPQKEKSRPKQNAIRPGKVWKDTEGKRIQAHGGAVWYEDGIYYWYGENKEFTDGKNGIWTSGIRAYSSQDLYNWKDEGLIIPPSADLNSNLHETKRVDRPHIIKSDATGKYVCWIKLSGSEACFVILSADRLLGPWQVEKENYRPMGWKVGDFDIWRDEKTGINYLLMDADHSGIVCMELTDDCLDVIREVSRQYSGLHAPFCREGVAVFEHNNRKYMLTSGMTGYIPNPSDAAVTGDWTEPFKSLGNPHVDDESKASFNSQISKVFKVHGKKELYIAMADRWVPEYKVDACRSDVIMRGIASRYEPEKYQVTPEEQRELVNSPMLTSADTSIADYVWLPVRFENGIPRIDWYDEWKLEDYESE